MKVTDTFSGSKVPKATKILYPAGTIFRDSAYTLVSLFFMMFVQYCAPLGYSWVNTGTMDTSLYTTQMLVISAIIIVLRIWDGFNDPIMGWIIEKCHFKTGKYKPWILIGGLTNAVVLFFMFFLRPVGWSYVICFGIFYLLWDFTFTMNDIGYWSMLPSLSSEEKERNTLTTLVAVCASIGAFAAGGVIPMLVAGNAVNMYAIVALVIATLFAASQVMLFFFCKEHKRDAAQEKISEDTKFSDMFRILKRNSQTRVATIVILIYYLGSAILNGFGMNYFYFNYGYSIGGSIQFYFTVAYAAGTIIAQCIFPLLIKKFSRGQLFTISFILICVGYIAFFVYDLKIGDLILGFKPAYLEASTSILDVAMLALLGIVIFTGEGTFYLVLLVMMTNTIEYNEFKFGERRESLIFALRPLTAKLSSALQQAVIAIGLSTTGLYAVSGAIGDLEVKKGLGSITESDVINGADGVIEGITNAQLIWLKVFMCALPLILFAVSYVLIKKKYFIDEKYYQNMIKVIEEKKSKEA